jgi:hypothetical protein
MYRNILRSLQTQLILPRHYAMCLYKEETREKMLKKVEKEGILC